MSLSSYLLEDQALVERCHQLLRENPRPALLAARRAREKYHSLGFELPDWVGWPLRPFFIPRTHLEFLSHSIAQQLELSRQLLLQAGDAGRVFELSPLSLGFLKALDLPGSLSSPWLLSMIRPDGFLYEDRYLVSELNCGNGVVVSNTYQEVLYHHLANSPLLEALGLEPRRGFRRSCQGHIDLIAAHLQTPTRGRPPLLGMLAPEEEWKSTLEMPPRVLHQIQHARLLLQERGIETCLMTEKDLKISRYGECANRHGRHLQGLLLVTLGTTFLKESERIGLLKGASAGNLPILSPLATLLWEKSVLPWMSDHIPSCSTGDFSVSLIPTSFPGREQSQDLRLTGKADWVLKHCYAKDTQMGNASHGRAWNRALEAATERREYVLQPRLALPKATVPVSPDGEHLEWVEVMVELSPFIINGGFAGAMARYSAYNDKVILSPPPPDMGMTLAYAV